MEVTGCQHFRLSNIKYEIVSADASAAVALATVAAINKDAALTTAAQAAIEQAEAYTAQVQAMLKLALACH